MKSKNIKEQLQVHAEDLSANTSFLSLDSLKYLEKHEIDAKYNHAFHPRAVHAFTLGTQIGSVEYNIYLAGDSRHGRTYFAKTILVPFAKEFPAPNDYVYAYNFEDEDKPLAIVLKNGQGRTLQDMQIKALASLRAGILEHLDSEKYNDQIEALNKNFMVKRDEIIVELEKIAATKDFSLDFNDGVKFTLIPLGEGKRLQDEDFDKLDASQRRELKQKGEKLLVELNVHLRELIRDEKNLRQEELKVQEDIAKELLQEYWEPLRTFFAENEKLLGYFKALEEDVLESIDEFILRPEEKVKDKTELACNESFFVRYSVNLFIDNSKQESAPVITEYSPTYFNLLGAIERETEMGAMYADFTLIRAGSLHRALGGFLIINVEDLLASPSTWDGLMRALRSKSIKIEDPIELEQIRSRTIEPEAIDLSVRIILVGTDEMYENLLCHDDRFEKYFCLKAHMQMSVIVNEESVKNYLYVIENIRKKENLYPFAEKAYTALLNMASALAEDNQRLALYFPVIREYMLEAFAVAKEKKQEIICEACFEEVRKNRKFRSNLYEEEYLADYDKEIIKVATKGEEIGRANGLSLTMFGDYEFGLPHQISCAVGVGHAGIVDLEREAKMGGPIHTKGMMIIKGYLLRLFAHNKPLILTGSLCFEQSYAGVEGDSASGAEFAALLSALAEVPINLSYAFTGALSQNGTIMAVGGVSSKVEGFFEVCNRRGLTGSQGVILPKDNLSSLHLPANILQAIKEKKFYIYAVESIEDAMEILTGLPCGTKSKTGKYTANSLYAKIDQNLIKLAKYAHIYNNK